MYYISDVSRLDENIVGVTDSTDNTIDYVYTEAVQESIANGVPVKGCVGNQYFTSIPVKDRFGEYKNEIIYLGDYIAPPVSNIVGKLYRAVEPISEKSVFLYCLFYKKDNTVNFSICALNLSDEDLNKYMEEFNKVEDNYCNYLTKKDASIIYHFTHNPVVDVSLNVLYNFEGLAEHLGVSRNRHKIKIRVLNTGLVKMGEFVSSLVYPMILDRCTFTDAFAPFTNSSLRENCLDFGGVTEVKNGYNPYKYFFDDLAFVAKRLLKGGKVAKYDITYNINNSIRVIVDVDTVFYRHSKGYFDLSNFSAKPESYDNELDFWDLLSKYYPNKVEYIKGKLDKICGENPYVVYMTLDGVFAVREDCLQLVGNDNLKVNKMKTRLKLLSPDVKIVSYVNNEINIEIQAKDNTEYDLNVILDKNALKGMKAISIKFTNNEAVNNMTLRLHDDFDDFKITGSCNFNNSVLHLPKSVKNVSREFAKYARIFNHIAVEEKYSLQIARRLMSMLGSSIRLEYFVQHFYDYSSYIATLTDESIKEIDDANDSYYTDKYLATIRKRISENIDTDEFKVSIKSLNTIPSSVMNNLAKYNIVDKDEVLYDLISCNFCSYRNADAVYISAWLNYISIVIENGLAFSQLMYDVTLEYVRYLRLFTQAYLQIEEMQKIFKPYEVAFRYDSRLNSFLPVADENEKHEYFCNKRKK